MRRAGIGTLAAALAIALAFAASALGSPTPSRSLERAATASSSPAALRAEARLRRIETRVLGRAHATEHARMRAGIRRERAIARRRARLGLPPKRRPAPRRAMALGDPSQVGRWSAPRGVPVVAVHAILLPTGRLMLVQQDADGGVAYILDPGTGAGHRVDPPGNIWCGGQTFLADGRLLAIGGTLEHIGGDNYSGLNHLYVFDPVTETWTRQADMRHGRWYPTGMRMPDGRVLITSGWDESGTMTMNADVEVYTPTGPTGRVDLVGSRSMNFYPHWFVLPDGRALLAGPGRSDSAFLNLSTFAFTNNPTLNASRNGYGSGVLLPGPPSGSMRVLLAGGGGTATTETFDAANPSAGWRPAASLPQIRRNLNTVILPDGDLLAVGGNSEGQEGSPQREALMYSPASNTWTPMAEQAEQRAYHSTALLLPDGRVWSGGDNTNSGGGNTGDAYEIFEPPYLFRGPRPVIASAPSALAYGQSFSVGSSGAAPSRAVLMSLGATTHGNDMNQRHVELAVSAMPGGIAAVAPPSANVAPPGHYMLFLLSADGVPSEAKIITVGTGGTPPPPPVNQPPVAAFTVAPASPVAGQPVTFTDASTDDGQVAGRAWDLDNDGQFDDGTGATATATFAAAGSYTVSLRVTDNGSPALSATTSRTVGVSATPPPPPPPGNLVANPSFETNLSGWSGYQATVAREAQAGAPDGGFVARVTRSTGTSFTIDGGRNVATTAATTYTASAWVRAASASSVGKPIQIKLRERNAAGTVIADVGSANVALSNTWQKLTVTRTAAAGNNLGVRLSHASAVTGDAFFADGFVLTAG